MERLKIAITGASGFIGANLVRYFSKKHEVFALSRNLDSWRLNGYNIIHFDIKNREEVKKQISKIKPDIIIHCAVYGGYHFETSTKEIIETNIIGTMNLIDACKQNTAILINTGSSSEYGIKDKPMKESDIIEPNTDYAMSKAIITNLLKQTEIKSITLRLFSIYGYYEEKHRLIPYVLYSSIKNEIAHLSNKNNVRDFVFIEDINKAYEFAIKKIYKINSGEIFNIGTGVQSKVIDVAKIAKARVVWSKDIRSEEPENRVWKADITKAKKELGWMPYYDLEKGLEKTKKWMIENINLYEDEKNEKYKRLKVNS